MSAVVIFVFSALTAAMYWAYYCHKPQSRMKSFTKTASIASLAVISLLAGLPSFLTLALAACALGDYLLSRNGEPAFVKGMYSFALGHVLYILLFINHSSFSLSNVFLPYHFEMALGLVLLGLAMMKFLWKPSDNLREVVVAYIIIIVLMGICATGLDWTRPLNMIAFGVLAFALSDMALAAETFILIQNQKYRQYIPYIVWGLYWLAQALILLGMLASTIVQ